MNKVILMGRLTKDPEMRFTASTNTPVCNFTLAVQRKYKADGIKADFISIVAWDKTAEFCNAYFKKGQQVAIAGRMQTRTWDDNEGKKHYVTEVVAEDAYFAEGKQTDDRAKAENQNIDGGFYPLSDEEELPF